MEELGLEGEKLNCQAGLASAIKII